MADIISFLLGRGADINEVGGKYGTALAAAASQGQIASVSLRLDRGANIDAVGGEYGTASAMAAIGGQTTILSLLLDRPTRITSAPCSSKSNKINVLHLW